MHLADKRMTVGVVLVVASALIAVALFLTRAPSGEESWKPHAEGLLAVPTPCCTEATLWDSLDQVSDDEQRPRPATAEEAARWLNTWPYRARGEGAEPSEPPLGVGVKNQEVRCIGQPSGPDIVPGRNDEYTLEAVRLRRECVFTKWRVWDDETVERRPNERHTIWAGDDGFFRARVDYWR
jgi:hypothetical protein